MKLAYRRDESHLVDEFDLGCTTYANRNRRNVANSTVKAGFRPNQVNFETII